VVILNTKGRVTIPAHLRDKYVLRPGDDVEVVEVGGALQIVRTEGPRAGGSGWRYRTYFPTIDIIAPPPAAHI
jgi:AbrB family looped-hinge helix DNA binding protein